MEPEHRGSEGEEESSRVIDFLFYFILNNNSKHSILLSKDFQNMKEINWNYQKRDIKKTLSNHKLLWEENSEELHLFQIHQKSSSRFFPIPILEKSQLYYSRILMLEDFINKLFR